MGKPRNPGPPPTQDDLEKAALRYLERFSSSVAGVRRVLNRRARRAAPAPDGEAGAFAAAIEAVLAKLIRMGLVDDGRFAEGRAGSLARRGASLFAIRRDLKMRGIAPALIDAALAQLKDEAGGTSDAADRLAAIALARRRRLGPYRQHGVRADWRDRDLAVLGRAGFALDVARSVIDGDREDG